MDIQQAVKTVLANYVNFDGRSGRGEFWWWVVAYIVGSIVVGIVGTILGISMLLSNLYSLGLFLPSLAVSVRRFHDIGKTGWWVLISIIPIIGWIAAIYFWAQPSQAGANDYGAGPQGPAS